MFAEREAIMNSSISGLALRATIAATIALAGCSTSQQQQPAPTSPTTSSVAPSSTTAAPSAAPTTAALTRQPCDLLTPEVAKKYVGEDAQRQLAYDARPPVPVSDDACYYTGATREIEVSIFPRPSDPTAPVNHFNVIRPDNRVDALSYEAYWFGPGESIVAVKDGLLISVKVANIKGSWTDQDRADDIELANLVVPRVG
jgi:hypothetical protein